jgi:hypothetical protein
MNDEIRQTVLKRRSLIAISSLTIAILSVYLGSVFLLHASFLGFRFRERHLALFTVGAVALVLWIFSKFPRRYLSLAMNMSLSILTTAILVIVVDVAYAVVQNVSQPVSSVVGYGRNRDSNYWIGEIQPRLYFPTKRNFYIYKPNITIKASSFGDLYSPDMLRSPTLVNSTLERRTVTKSINKYGFREAEPIGGARIFALGDSFTYGIGVDAGKTWVKQLEGLLSAPIYNLGVSGVSPKQELESLKFLLKAKPTPVKIRHLLWMIFEGNDLEEPYDEMVSVEPVSLIRGTVIEALTMLPTLIKSESVISKMMKGEIQIRYSDEPISSSALSIDGVDLVNPIFKSERMGYKLFSQDQIQRAQQPRSYVVLHPNRSKLERVFREMGELARDSSFEVAVILAPSASRLQGKYFADFPKISARPYFLEFIAGLARMENFQVINLWDSLRPFADQRLLYFRDGTHWNENGHFLVAKLIARQLSKFSFQAHVK